VTPDRAVSARRAWAEIDLDAIADNLRAAALLARPARVMAVVKADGYGHGAVAVARTAAAAGAAALGVATVDEGLALREAAIDLPIVVLGPARGEEEAAFAADLALTVVDEEGGRAAAEAARKRGVAGGVHLKVDTGMTRLGVDPGALPLLLEQMAGWADLRVDGVFTHLAAADSDPEFTREQVALFGSAAALVRARFPDALRHAAATAGLFTLPAARFDMVRLGLGLYGLYPAPDLRAAAPLRPAMTLWSRVVQVRPVAAGATVSYGRTHRVLSATRIATVAIGYADGYPRVLGGRARMRLGDRFYPVVGRVTMDYTMLDVGDGPAAAGDVVQVFGPDLPADEVATQASTISYEIVTRIGPRVPRIYRAGGAIAGVRDARGAAGIALPTPLPAPSRPR
jgi:alanine racemase